VRSILKALARKTCGVDSPGPIDDLDDPGFCVTVAAHSTTTGRRGPGEVREAASFEMSGYAVRRRLDASSAPVPSDSSWPPAPPRRKLRFDPTKDDWVVGETRYDHA
jgi:hypothetical protein